MNSIRERGYVMLSEDRCELKNAKILPEEPSRFEVRSRWIINENESDPYLRPKYDPEDGLRVLVCFPSLKPTKNKPLFDWIEKRIKETVNTDKISLKPFTYEVKNTGVGEQPYHTDDFHGGKIGAMKRIRHGLTLVEDVVSEYHAVFFIAVESDIDKRGEQFYDKANIVVFEYHSRYTGGVMSRGPTVQPEFFSLITEGETYGKVLAKRFGVPHDDWHRVVCRMEKELNSRSAFINEALGYLMSRDSLESIFCFCNYV